jgi:hypothetical protein
LNKYLYVTDNPVNLTDPTGNEPAMQGQTQTAAVGELSLELGTELWLGLGDVLVGAAATFSTVAGFLNTLMSGAQVVAQIEKNSIDVTRGSSTQTFQSYVGFYAEDLRSMPLSQVINETQTYIQATTYTLVNRAAVKSALLNYAYSNNIAIANIDE